VRIDEEPDVFLMQFRELEPEVGHLFAAHWCQSEVRDLDDRFYAWLKPERQRYEKVADEYARPFAT
jgi:hypothetical protein